MNISKLATKPQLQEIKLDDQDIVDSYGEIITFWMKDHLDLATYFDFYKFQQESSSDQLMNTLRKIILNEEGKQAIEDDCILPVDITLAVMVKINENLGKSKAKSSKKKVGTQV
jgi:hypothetical protein